MWAARCGRSAWTGSCYDGMIYEYMKNETRRHDIHDVLDNSVSYVNTFKEHAARFVPDLAHPITCASTLTIL